MTTFANIALDAEVSLSNVYYCFKQKTDIGVAVLNAIILEQKIFFQHLDAEPNPKIRLHHFLEHAKQNSVLVLIKQL